MEIIREENPKARKEYICDAIDLVWDAISDGIFNFSEYREIGQIKKKNWKIKKGEVYIKQIYKDSGHFYTFRAHIKMHNLCLKYDLYDD